MKELMIAVERVVRPVWAGPRRKMKMRQELLTHLTSAYEEGRARLGNDASALEEAVRRFGNPADLTRDLQASVPFYERTLFAPLPGTKWLTALEGYLEGKEGESSFRRIMLSTWLWLWISFALALGPAIIIYESRYDAVGAFMALVWCAVTAGAAGVFLVGFHATYRELSRPLRLTAVLRATLFAALALAAPAVAFAAMLHWMLEIPIHYDPAAGGVFIGVLMMLGISFLVRCQETTNRGREEWTSLEIGD